jgi:hypothetical protein
MIKTLMTQTEREKIGTLDGINLFFGALLGANLGSLDGVSLLGYSLVVILLAGTVMALRIFCESERRAYAAFLLGIYVVTVGLLLYRGTALRGLPTDDRWRLGITLAIWVMTVIMTVYFPMSAAQKEAAEARR